MQRNDQNQKGRPNIKYRVDQKVNPLFYWFLTEPY